MKICKKCGAVQDDSRVSCLDCGALLGKPVSEAEESRVEAELGDAIDSMGERTEPYYVSAVDKILALVGIAAVVAVIVILSLTNAEKDKIKSQLPGDYYPGEFIFYVEEDGYLTASNAAPGEIQEKLDRCGKIGVYAIIGLFCLAGAVIYLLFPKFVWLADTMRLRLYIDESNLSPSWGYLFRVRLIKYGLFGVGMAMAAAAVLAYFGI